MMIVDDLKGNLNYWKSTHDQYVWE